MSLHIVLSHIDTNDHRTRLGSIGRLTFIEPGRLHVFGARRRVQDVGGLVGSLYGNAYDARERFSRQRVLVLRTSGLR